MSDVWQWLLGAGAAIGGAVALGLGSSRGRFSGGASAGGDVPWAGPPVAGLPAGKGVFVRHVSHGGPPELFAERMQYLGMRWVMIQSMFHERDGADGKPRKFRNDQTHYREYGDALRDVGCIPWVWGWPRPESDAEFADLSFSAVERLGAAGLVINTESAYRTKDRREDALRLMSLCRAGLGGLPLGVTSYGGGPKWIKSYPWEEFAACDFAIPQWYDSRDKLGPHYPRKAADRYYRAGYKNLIPAWGASRVHTPEHMQVMTDRSPQPVGAGCFWDLWHLLRSRERVAWVRGFDIREPGAVA